MGRVIRYTLAGAFGMLAAWMVMEPTPLMPDVERDLTYPQYFLIGLIAGLFVGVMLGIAGALSAASSRDAIKGILVSSLFGAAGGVIGLSVGSRVYSLMFGLASSAGFFSFIMLLIGRGLGWAVIGGLIGMSHGVAASSPRKIINGGVGGCIGGGIGGSVFEILAWMNKSGLSGNPPALIRFIAFAATGAAIGLFLGLVEELTKQAWLIKLAGRNEGREIALDKPVTVLGRDEYADIPVFGDPDVAQKHAVIISQDKRHAIEDAGSFYGTRINGVKLTRRELLADGDLIEVGKTKFKYKDKATARNRPSSYIEAGIPNSSHLCQFCGAVKDANGNCDCTVAQQDSSRTASIPAGQTLHDSATVSTFAQPPAGSPKLVGISGPYSSHTFLLAPETTIGREASKDIALSMDNSVSRNHARIAIEGGACIIYDDGSTNGIFVNKARITRHQLQPKDVVQVGSTQFRFEAD